jgi:hypothetical protein
MHEFEELIDNRLEELPMRLKEARILPDNVHDVAGDDGFVVLAALHFRESQEVLDHRDEEPLLGLFVHG